MTQEADPKLAKLRLAYESAVQHEHAEAIAALDRGGRPVAPARCRELTESAWRELSAYIAGRERERWEVAVRAYLDAVHRSLEYASVAFEAELWQAERDLRALLQPEQEAEAR